MQRLQSTTLGLRYDPELTGDALLTINDLALLKEDQVIFPWVKCTVLVIVLGNKLLFFPCLTLLLLPEGDPLLTTKLISRMS